MTFEEKKQKIIDEIIEMEDFWIIQFALDEDSPLSHVTSNALKELQPDKPKCSTCKYLKEEKNYYCGDVYMGDRFKCTNLKMPFESMFCENGEDDFGCIYHEEK